jgi:predicted  nucleic acid-binding Zn-ribbon protein
VENELRVRADEAVANANEVTSQVASLEIALEDAETSQQDLANQIELLKNRGLKAEESATSSHTALDKLRAESERRILDLEEELTSALESKAEHEAELSHLQASQEEAQKETGRLEEARRAELEEASQEAATLKNELKNLATTESLARDEIDKLREASESQISALENRPAEAEEAGGAQGKKVSHLEALLADAEQEYKEAEDRLRAELEERTAEATTLHGEVEEFRTSQDALRQELEEALTAADALQQDLEGARAELVDYKERAGETEGRLARELEESGETARSREDRVETLESAAQEAALEVAREAGERDEFMTVGLDTVEGDDEASRGEIATLRATVDRLNAELEGQALEYGDAAAQMVQSEERGGRRWLPATGLVAAGLVVGVLAAGPVARLLPSGSANWFSDKGSSGSVSVAEAGAADALLEVQVPSRGEELEAATELPAATEAGAVSTDGPVDVADEVVEPAYPPAVDVARAWASAWSDQRVDDYLSYYSRDFRPPNGAGRRAWEAYRRERVAAPDSIEITLTEVTETALDDGRVEVVFVQAYTAGAYSDKVRKTLVMKQEDGSWKILSEDSVAL